MFERRKKELIGKFGVQIKLVGGGVWEFKLKKQVLMSSYFEAL